MKRLVLVLILAGLITTGFSQQKIKLGHLNSNDLLEAMPEKAKAQKSLQDYSKQLEDQLTTMQDELEKKYNDYLSKKDSLSDLIKKNREDELMSLQQRIQTFQGNAQQELQKKEQDLLKPIIDKAKQAIEDVAKEFEGKIKIAKLNAGEYPEIADKYGVSSIPNFTIFKEGQVVEQFTGAISQDELEEKLCSYIDDSKLKKDE